MSTAAEAAVYSIISFFSLLVLLLLCCSKLFFYFFFSHWKWNRISYCTVHKSATKNYNITNNIRQKHNTHTHTYRAICLLYNRHCNNNKRINTLWTITVNIQFLFSFLLLFFVSWHTKYIYKHTMEVFHMGKIHWKLENFLSVFHRRTHTQL